MVDLEEKVEIDRVLMVVNKVRKVKIIVKALVVKLMARNEGRPVHTVYSGLNQALRDAGYNPIASTEEAVKAGVVFMRFCKGGALVGLKAFAQGDSAKTLAVKSDLSDILKAATRKS